MTWLFNKEKELMKQGLIAMFLYQNEEVRQKNMPLLKRCNDDPSIAFMTFKPYFHNDSFPFIAERSGEYFGCGRISRQDADKFAANTLHIYEYFVSPLFKRGLFLGFDQRSREKIGEPYGWIRTARDQREVSQQDFYKHCEIVLQPRTRRKTGREWALRPWPAEAYWWWTTAEVGARWWSTAKPDGCATMKGTSSTTPARWPTNRT